MTTEGYQTAIGDFYQARRQADLEKILSFLTGKSAELLSFNEVVKTLKITGSSLRKLQEIPLDKIVGSVGRYADFTRRFLPKSDSDKVRWSRVKSLVTGLRGAPPIEVYQIDQVYFVIDGNHRVSVARQLGVKCIEAYVTNIRTAIPLTPDTQPDDLIINAEYKQFLERTRLDELRPGKDLTVTAPGKYRLLEEQIAAHCRCMESAQHRKIPLAKVVTEWYDTVYSPVAHIIQQQGILRDFPNRTVADMYIWISQYRTDVEKQLGWKICPETAATEFVHEYSPTPARIISRVGEKLYDVLTPDELESGPATGEWRREALAEGRKDHVFSNILVPVSGEDREWCVLDQAIEVARCEEGRIYGLHIVSSKSQENSQEALAVKAEFDRRCTAAGIQGECALETGEVAIYYFIIR